jgi:hypothetical protein
VAFLPRPAGDGDLPPGQLGELGVQARLVALDGDHVMRAALGDQVIRVGALGRPTSACRKLPRSPSPRTLPTPCRRSAILLIMGAGLNVLPSGRGGEDNMSQEPIVALSDSNGICAVYGENYFGGQQDPGPALNAGVEGISTIGPGVYGRSENDVGVEGRSGNSAAIVGTTINGNAGIIGSATAHGVGVLGAGPAAWGNVPYDANDAGVVGLSWAGQGVQGISQTGNGVYAESRDINHAIVAYAKLTGSQTNYAAGVYAESTNGDGVIGMGGPASAGVSGTAGSIGVQGTSVTGYGVTGYSESSKLSGIYGWSTQSTGVVGRTDDQTDTGVYGINGVLGHCADSQHSAVEGHNTLGVGVYGSSDEPSSPGVYGENTSLGYAGYFVGNVSVTGTLFAPAGGLLIDHPQEPDSRYLSHSFVASPEMLTIYSGSVTTNGSGEAAITLPPYFEALNKDFRYQLTVQGTFAQAIVDKEIAQNRFTIRTDKPEVHVYWQVTGVRRDPFAHSSPMAVERDKPAEAEPRPAARLGSRDGDEQDMLARIKHMPDTPVSST